MDKDLKGNVIEQRRKDGHSVEVDGRGRFAGHRFLLKTKLYGDKRCIYCGRWFHWKDTDSFEWIRTQNIDNMNPDKGLEPLHCGSEHCQEFHRRYLIASEKRKIQEAERRHDMFFSLFRRLKSEGMVR